VRASFLSQTSMASLSHSQIVQFLQDQINAEDLPAPEWGPIGEDVYKRSYSRNIVEDDGSVSPGWNWRIPDSRTTEVWAETVRRVVLGNKAYAGDIFIDDEMVELFRLIYEFKAIPAGRHLWMTGVPGAALKNCHRAGWSADVADHFRFMAQQLFTGGGVGSNYSKVYRSRGGRVKSTVDVTIGCAPTHQDYAAIKQASGELWWENARQLREWQTIVVVEDTREGWVDAWVRLIRLAHESGDHAVFFDLSEIRPHGAPLRSFGGRASGPAPLAESLRQISQVLNGAAGQSRILSAIEAMQIDHYIAAAVVAGGTRRSARMSQLNWDDPEIMDFIAHKKDDPSVSWSTNISVVVDDQFIHAADQGDTSAIEVLNAVARGMTLDGEPGLFNVSLASVGERGDVGATNPCGEIALEEHYDPETGKGSSSGESCNLGAIDLDAIGQDDGEVMKAAHLMARFLYRATLAPIYDTDQAEIENRNRRLGVGIMGLQGWCASHGARLSDLPNRVDLRHKLERLRQQARRSANEIADELGLPHPIKVTTVAPTGTTAQLRGTQAGIHPVYARYFVRRVQYSDTDPRLSEMIAKGYHVEDSIYAAHTKVVAIPVQDIILSRHPEHLIEQADEIDVETFLAIQATVQETLCGGLDGNAISATANIPATGVDPVALSVTLLKYLPDIKGVTVFPAVSRPQTPITAVSKGEYHSMLIELEEAVAAGDSNSGECATGACPIR
jgi:ribonucleoside-triphosphate reductase